MKPSELRLLALMNSDNNMRVKETEVVFNAPRTVATGHYNSRIVVNATDIEDNRFRASHYFDYNRFKAENLGVVSVTSTEEQTDIDAVTVALLERYDIPTQADELHLLYEYTDPDGIGSNLLFDFVAHPMIYGTLRVYIVRPSVSLTEQLATVSLGGFVPGDIT